MDYLLTFFFLVAAHYFKWDLLTPSLAAQTVKGRIFRYVLGTLGMLTPFAFWLYEQGEMMILIKLAGFVVAAGCAPVMAYLYDHILKAQIRLREASEENELLRGMYEQKRGNE